jgi:hypothetical protein
LLNPNGVLKISLFFFLGKKRCEDIGVGQNLTEFAKIPMLKSLKIYYFILFLKKKIFTKGYQIITLFQLRVPM